MTGINCIIIPRLPRGIGKIPVHRIIVALVEQRGRDSGVLSVPLISHRCLFRPLMATRWEGRGTAREISVPGRKQLRPALHEDGNS
jgi:hypothetical protein